MPEFYTIIHQKYFSLFLAGAAATCLLRLWKGGDKSPAWSSQNFGSTGLCILEIESLELRRLHSDLIYVYKMLFGLVDLNFTDYFTLRADSVTRGHKYKLFID